MYIFRRLKLSAKTHGDVLHHNHPRPTFRSEPRVSYEMNGLSEKGAVDEEEKHREALRDLMESWMDRLQLISLITTFFASTEAGLLSITTRESLDEPMPALEQVANAGFVGALVLHTNAAVISFLAAFFLIRYKLHIAKDEEWTAEADDAKNKKAVDYVEDVQRDNHINITNHLPSPREIEIQHHTIPSWTRNPRVVQVGPFESKPPTHLLARCHAVCILFSALGFILALTGILCFTWSRHPRGVSIFGSVCMVSCLVTGGAILVFPSTSPDRRRSLIYAN